MTVPYADPSWPRASAWLAGEHRADARASLAVLGVPLTTGSITPSACDLAPAAVRQALVRFSTYDLHHELDLLELSVEDLGDLPLAGSSVELAVPVITRAVDESVRGSDAVVLLGGDNSITYPACLALESQLAECGLLTLDAHLDLRDLSDGLRNGNPVRALLRDGLPGANIIQIGIQSFSNSAAYHGVARQAGMEVIAVERVRAEGLEKIVCQSLEKLSTRCRSIYVDLDLDVLDRAFSPGPAGSRPGGLTPAELRLAAFACGRHPQVRIMDLVELDPTRDVNDVTALSAAACLLSFASGVLARTGGTPAANESQP